MISGCFSYIANRCDILADEQAQCHSSDVPRDPISRRQNEGPSVRKLAEESQRAQESEGSSRDVGRSVQKMSRISILQSGVSIGYAGGYFLGGFVMQYWGFRASFAVLAVINVFNFLYVLLLVPEIKPSSQIKKNPTRMYGSLAEISAPLQQFSKPDAQQNSQTPSTPSPPLPASLSIKLSQGKYMRSPFQLIADSVYTTFIKRKTIPFGRTKLLLALCILWIYLLVEFVQDSLDYQYLPLVRTFTKLRFGVWSATERLLMWVALATVLPSVKYIWRHVDAITLNVIVVLSGMISEASALVLLALIVDSNWLFIGNICS